MLAVPTRALTFLAPAHFHRPCARKRPLKASTVLAVNRQEGLNILINLGETALGVPVLFIAPASLLLRRLFLHIALNDPRLLVPLDYETTVSDGVYQFLLRLFV